MKTNVYLLDGTLFASGFNRVVHGGRGDYVEFEETPAKYVKLELSAAENSNCVSTSEVELYRAAGELPTGIEVADTSATSIHIGYVGDVEANILPAGYSNQYFTAVSSNPEIARIITLADENGYPIYKVVGMSAGKAEITLASAADPTKTTTYTVEVLEGPDKSDLQEAIQNAQGVVESLYTADSYATFKAAYDEAVRRIAQYVNIDGFRRGKAPRTVIERQVGTERIKHEALDKLMPSVIAEAI